MTGICAPSGEDNRVFFEMGKQRYNITNNPCRQKILEMLVEMVTDAMQVFDFGAQKHPDSGDVPNFLEENGNRCSKKDRGSSVLRHAARTFMHPEALDEESNLPELLHLISSASILYIRQKRKVVHPEDSKAKVNEVDAYLENLK